MNESKKPTINWIDDVQEEMWDSIVYLEKLKTILKEEKKDFLEEAEKEKKELEESYKESKRQTEERKSREWVKGYKKWKKNV